MKSTTRKQSRRPTIRTCPIAAETLSRSVSKLSGARCARPTRWFDLFRLALRSVGDGMKDRRGGGGGVRERGRGGSWGGREPGWRYERGGVVSGPPRPFGRQFGGARSQREG